MKFTPDQTLMALSWKQPYAELMLHGKIETRTWNTNYRGWVLICASQKSYTFDEVFELSAGYHTKITKLLGRNADHYLANWRSGIAIGVGRLVDCIHSMDLTNQHDWDKTFVKFNGTKYLHVYEDVREIHPIPFKGSRKWSEVTMEIKKQIKFIK